MAVEVTAPMPNPHRNRAANSADTCVEKMKMSALITSTPMALTNTLRRPK